MDTLTAIASRRSIRKFRPDPIPRELIERLLEATVQAPSAKKVQPWRFVVLEGERNQYLADLMLDKAVELRARRQSVGSVEWAARAMLRAAVAFGYADESPSPRRPLQEVTNWPQS